MFGRPCRQTRCLAGLLSLLAVLVNLFGWALLPAEAAAAPIASVTADSVICHADLPQTHLPGQPKCVQCFPLLSAASGAMAPPGFELPAPAPLIADSPRPQATQPIFSAARAPYPVRGPPAGI